jgi:hypothetical protein
LIERFVSVCRLSAYEETLVGGLDDDPDQAAHILCVVNYESADVVKLADGAADSRGHEDRLGFWLGKAEIQGSGTAAKRLRLLPDPHTAYAS